MCTSCCLFSREPWRNMDRTNCCEKNGACYNSTNRPENRLTQRSRKISFAHKIQFNRRTLLKLYTNHDNMTWCRISDVSIDEKDRTKWDLVKFEFTICFGRNVMSSLRTVAVKLPLISKVLHHLWKSLKSWVPVLYISANILVRNNYPDKRGVLNNCGANKVDFGWNVVTGCFTISVLHPNILGKHRSI